MLSKFRSDLLFRYQPKAILRRDLGGYPSLKNWNIEGEIKSFAEELVSDKYLYDAQL